MLKIWAFNRQVQGLNWPQLAVNYPAVIDSDGKLAAFLPGLQTADWVAVDTEADSLHAYPEKLCLLQISTALGDELIDPLAEIDLSPLWCELKKHQLLMHGSDYDLRLLRKNHQFVPNRIFDTMLASRLLGEREFGLGSLVKNHLAIVLEKGSQKADWSKRPLTPRMEEYARADTHYLKPVSDILRQQLREKNRLTWLEQSCERLISECAIAPVPDLDSVWRIKGSHKLTRPALAICREIYRWREQEAVASNKPPYFILNHETVIALSAAGASEQPVQKLIPNFLTSRRRDGLLHAIELGQSIPAEQQPDYLRSQPRRQTESQRLRFIQLEQHRNARATELELDPTLIASRAVLLALAEDWNLHQGDLMEWQRELLV